MHAYIISGSTQEERKNRIDMLLSERAIGQFSVVPILPEPDQSITVEDVRQFGRSVRLSPNRGELQAGILSDAHLMTTQAQNALLKLLEEPPVSLVIILETAQPESLLDTIHSRCVHIRLRGQSPDAENQTTIGFDHDLFSLSGKTLAALTEHGGSKDAARRFFISSIQALAQAPQYRTNRGGLRRVYAEALSRLLFCLSSCEGNIHPQLSADALLFEDLCTDFSRL